MEESSSKNVLSGYAYYLAERNVLDKQAALDALTQANEHKTGTRRSGSDAESSRAPASTRRANPAAWKAQCPSRNSAGSAAPRAERE